MPLPQLFLNQHKNCYFRRTFANVFHGTEVTEDLLPTRTQKHTIKPNQPSDLCTDHRSQRNTSSITCDTLLGAHTPFETDTIVTETSLDETSSIDSKDSPFPSPLSTIESNFNMIFPILESTISLVDYKPLPDICVYDIQMEGLSAILRSKVPLGFYLYYLLQEYNSENLFFLLEVERYENSEHETDEDRYEAAQYIYRTFITKDGPLEVNLEDRIHKIVLKELQEKKCQRFVFSAAKRHVRGLMGLSYHRFVHSSLWSVMITHCDLHTVYYDEATRIAITDKLLSYTHHQEAIQHFDSHPLLVSGGLPIASHFPCDTINRLVRDFCRTFLAPKTGYDYCLSPWSSSHISLPSVHGKSSWAKIKATSRMRRKSSNTIKRTGGIRLDFFSKKLSSVH